MEKLSIESELRETAKEIARILTRKKLRLVLAESCTGGLLASLFTEIPGISNVFCGSLVVYREDSKKKWLGVSSRTLARASAVSRQIAEEMVQQVLKRTPEASLAAAITGNLGPRGKPLGRVYLSVLKRSSKRAREIPRTIELDIAVPSVGANVKSLKKQASISTDQKAAEARLERRRLAALAVLFLVRDSLKV